MVLQLMLATEEMDRTMPLTARRDHIGDKYSSEDRYSWDINDGVLPIPVRVDAFQEWPDNHCHYMYSRNQEEAARHACGWAMRNTNNHNVNILKKSCLGVLVCNEDCMLEDGKKVNLRPAICDKARRKQIGRPCLNSSCKGTLVNRPCRGHAGYPVTHFWRHANGLIYFQAKGMHDHPRPQTKASTDLQLRRTLIRAARKKALTTRWNASFAPYPMEMVKPPTSLSSVLPNSLTQTPYTDKDPGFFSNPSTCSCPPFECICSYGASHLPTFQPDTTRYNLEPLNLVLGARRPVYRVDSGKMHSPTEMFYSDLSLQMSSYSSQLAMDSQWLSSSHCQVNLTSEEKKFSQKSNYLDSKFKDCMYSSENKSLEFPTARKPDCLQSSLDSYFDWPTSTSYSMASLTSTMGASAFTYPSDGLSDWAKGTTDPYTDFDVNEPGDILSLDQPIGKPVSQVLVDTTTESFRQDQDEKQTDDIKDINNDTKPQDPDLPSISYFFDSGAAENTKPTKEKGQDRETSTAFVGTATTEEPSSVNQDQTTSPSNKSLTELTPMQSKDASSIPFKPWNLQDSSSTNRSNSTDLKSAFQPYDAFYVHNFFNQPRPGQAVSSPSSAGHENCQYCHNDAYIQCPTAGYNSPCLPNHSINITLTYNPTTQAAWPCTKPSTDKVHVPGFTQ